MEGPSGRAAIRDLAVPRCRKTVLYVQNVYISNAHPISTSSASGALTLLILGHRWKSTQISWLLDAPAGPCYRRVTWGFDGLGRPFYSLRFSAVVGVPASGVSRYVLCLPLCVMFAYLSIVYKLSVSKLFFRSETILPLQTAFRFLKFRNSDPL